VREAVARVIDSVDPAALVTAENEAIAMRIVCVNHAFVRNLRCSAADVIGHSALLLCGARIDWDYLKLLATGVRSGLVATCNRTRFDDTVYRAVVSVTSVRDATLRATHVMVTEHTCVELVLSGLPQTTALNNSQHDRRKGLTGRCDCEIQREP
jgi:hypothetical protein